ncbi:ribosome-associated translation inhibitor RaiA [Olleya sp. YS]|uniref:ribosome hibernation-promoting factor, HPF/YfiA family n=1 Tax=Olleya sp. YS TaxID=3028318 RepID=UPI0024341DEA|nr:ribosome-associated translation inhibitor RaiA [Olleya sp. YS]WGD34528.1 ribosome-associated translation inhibitor RaiA [Olleya sp. YS]
MSKIIFEYHDVTASDSLEAYTTDRLNKLFERNDFVIRADVFFKTENTATANMVASIRLSAPGPRLFAEAAHDNFRSAVTECVDELQRQLAKRKESLKTY